MSYAKGVPRTQHIGDPSSGSATHGGRRFSSGFASIRDVDDTRRIAAIYFQAASKILARRPQGRVSRSHQQCRQNEPGSTKPPRSSKLSVCFSFSRSAATFARRTGRREGRTSALVPGRSSAYPRRGRWAPQTGRRRCRRPRARDRGRRKSKPRLSASRASARSAPGTRSRRARPRRAAWRQG